MSLDITAINNELTQSFVSKMGAAPGKFRDENPDEYVSLRASVNKAYLQEGPTPGEMAKGFNNLSFRMRRLGYGPETIVFAENSSNLAPFDINQIVNNKSFEAYAIGMMNGDYDRGLAAYEALDAYMQDHEVFDTTAKIKSLQNKGQILHRMGMEDPSNYKRASSNYDTALELLEISKLDDATKALFDSQLRFCRAKTSLHRAHLEPENASVLIAQAYGDISIALVASDVPGFEFEHACMKIVKGCIEASLGESDLAADNVEEGLNGLLKYGPTLTPRHVSAESKLRMIMNRELTPAAEKGLSQRLSDYHGRQAIPHPDRAFMAENAKRAVTPIPGVHF